MGDRRVPEWQQLLLVFGIREGRSLGRFSDTKERGSESAGTGRDERLYRVLPVPFSSAEGGYRTTEEVDCSILALGSAKWWIGLWGGCSLGRAWMSSTGESGVVVGLRVETLVVDIVPMVAAGVWEKRRVTKGG